MKAKDLYQKMELDFITPEMSDDWAPYMGEIEEFLTDNFKKRSMGLVCDFAEEINKVYTAVFPSNPVMQKILDEDAHDSMLFVHHPSIWDIRRKPVFYQMDQNLLEEFRKRRISIYNLHVPLDNFGKYSTSSTLAKALGIESETPFAPYFGALAGVFGKTTWATVQELQKAFEKAVGHEVVLYNYGDNSVSDGRVAIVAGGGLIEEIEEVAKNGIKTFLTGITAKNDFSKEAHEIAQKNRINLLGATHYSTEKFACKAMIEYFEGLSLPAVFIEDLPVMEDM